MKTLAHDPPRCIQETMQINFVIERDQDRGWRQLRESQVEMVENGHDPVILGDDKHTR